MTGVLLVVLLIVIVAVVAIAGALIAMYNGLVKLNIKVEEAWSGITVQLKRRADLIPNLVETVKGYAAHEKGVFEKVTEARASIMNATTPHDAAKADGELTSALKSLFAVSENYPELKASQNFTDLQNQITDTEDKIAASRRFYNAVVTLNAKCSQQISLPVCSDFMPIKSSLMSVRVNVLQLSSRST